MDCIAVEHLLGLWSEAEGGRATLVNLSENHTYRIDSRHGRHMLRLHRPGYQSRAAIESELDWITALRGLLPVPRPLPGRDGALVQEVSPGRFAVLFAFEPGAEPAPSDDLGPLFRTLGRYAATAHHHVETWRQPPGFSRPAWTADTILDAGGLWGDWRRAPHIHGVIRHSLDALDRRLREDLGAYGRNPSRFGLIHADMRLANLLVDGGNVTLIDFDDCGFGWFVYDLAASLSFIETRPDLARLKAAWIEGYTAIRPLSAADIAMIEPMILLRRMALLAWIGTHGETELARQHAGRFAHDTVELAASLLG